MIAVDKAQFWRSDQWPGIELMRAHWMHHAFAKHFHDCYTIGINDRGTGHFYCRREKHQALPGTLNLIGPGETHTGQASAANGWLYRDFYISPERMAELARHVDNPGVPEFQRATVHDPALADQFREAFDAIVLTPTIRLEQDYLLLKCVRTLLVRHTAERPSGTDDKTVAHIRDYIQGYWAEEVTVATLSVVTQRSPYHLIRVFNRQMGMPPHAYQIVLRVNEAQKQLRAGSNIAQVALACGFYDQSHMNRAFRRVLGTTPGTYRL